MASELVAQLPYPVFRSSKTMGYDASCDTILPKGGRLYGLPLPKLSSVSSGEEATYHTLFTIPASLTMGTGLTFKLFVTDDGSTPGDLGLVVRLGVTVKAVLAGETEDETSSGGTEQTVDVTLQSTTQCVSIGSLAIASANLDSAVVGSTVAVRVRRIGSHANDTAKGRVVLVHAYVQNT